MCVVGGGFTGLWTALKIKRLAPDVDIALVERRVLRRRRHGATAAG